MTPRDSICYSVLVEDGPKDIAFCINRFSIGETFAFGWATNFKLRAAAKHVRPWPTQAAGP